MTAKYMKLRMHNSGPELFWFSRPVSVLGKKIIDSGQGSALAINYSR